MCYHEYTHYRACNTHIPIHVHACPKNFTQDASRVIFCEDYKTIKVTLAEPCPYCTPRSAPAPSPGSGSGNGINDRSTPGSQVSHGSSSQYSGDGSVAGYVLKGFR
jgi:hypothetical protein